MQSAAFRFNAEEHEYSVDGRRVPHITGLLTVAGWTDERWFDDDASERGRGVHQGTADYDLGALTRKAIERPGTPWRPWLLAWVAWGQVVAPRWQHVEVAAVHKRLGFGGRPDRVGLMYGARSVCEVKSGAVAKGHMVQTALQAILVEEELALPAELITRYAVYVNERGRFKMEEHRNQADFREARRIIARYC